MILTCHLSASVSICHLVLDFLDLLEVDASRRPDAGASGSQPRENLGESKEFSYLSRSQKFTD
jgi:hypothetical protein